MLKKLRKIIQEALNEVLGAQLDIQELSDIISKNISEYINQIFDKINDGYSWDFTYNTKATGHITSETKIELVKTKIDFKFSDKLKIGGSFSPDNTVLLDNGNYEVLINFKISTNDLSHLKENIDQVIAHELNHAFVYIKQLSNKSKKPDLNSVNKLTRGTSQELFLKYPSLRIFSDMIYLSNPMEIQARVQEAATELKTINKKTSEETINALLKYNPLIDAKKMIAFKLEEINKIDRSILVDFVKTFNSNIKLLHKDKDVKIINGTDSFFKYWLKVINQNGDKLARKIFKLVADKHNIHEHYVYEQTDYGAYNKIFGECYSDF